MKSLVTPLIDRQQWLEDFNFDRYSPDQQTKLWDLLTRGMETQALDVLLDHLNQADQRALLHYLTESDIEDQLEGFLSRKIPDHQELLRTAILRYKEQLKRDLTRLAK